MKNVVTGSLTLVSVGTSGQIANDASRFARVNDEAGTLVTFLSLGSNLGANDNNSSYDIFVRDLTTGTTTLHSRTPSGEAAMYGANYGSLDSSGRYLAFSSNSNDLLMGDNNGNLFDVFIKDLQTGIIEKLETEYRNNYPFFAFPWIGDDFTPTWSQDGAYLIYHSLPDSSIAEEPGIRLFRRELATGKTDVVNTRHDLLPGSTGSGSAFNPSVSETGRYVAFESNSNTLEVNGSNVRDVYLRDRELRRTIKVSERAYDGSNVDGLSRIPSIDGSGRFVAFESDATNLI